MSKHKNINFWWTIGVLIALIIVLLSILFTTKEIEEKPSILMFLEFSGTLLSVVLSIFAIAYSYTSMIQSNHQWNHVSQATKSIETNTKLIIENNTNLLALVHEMSTTVHHLDRMMGPNNQIQIPLSNFKSLEGNQLSLDNGFDAPKKE